MDYFIKNMQINNRLECEFVPYDQFKNIKFIAKVESYEATWIDGNIQGWNKKVILKKLNNFENISKKLNEVQYSTY